MSKYLIFLASAFENPYADFEKDYDAKVFGQVLEPVSVIVSVALGVIVVGVCMMAAIVTATDVLFMTIPSARDRILQIVDKFRREGSKSPTFSLLSKQAIDATEESVQSGKNVYLIYLRKRALYYIVLSIVIFLMVSGWNSIVNLIAKIVVNILKSVGLI